MHFNLSRFCVVRLRKNAASLLSEMELLRRYDEVYWEEFRVAFLCLHVVSSNAFLAAAACSAFHLAAGPRKPLSLC